MNALSILESLRDSPQLFEQIRASSRQGLALQQELRRNAPDEIVRAALALEDARRSAAGKIPSAEQLWLTREGVEQATHWKIARHKAARFPEGRSIIDLCSGIGVDTAWLSTRGSVRAVDRDPLMGVRSSWNQAVWGLPHDVPAEQITEDVRLVDLSGQWVHADPDRRNGRDRPSRRLEGYEPDLAWMQQLEERTDAAALKISPAANFQQKFPGCEIELISVDGECREAVVWMGALTSGVPFRASLAATGETLGADPLSAWAEIADEPGAWIYDPDPAIVRAGLVDVLARELAVSRMDDAEEYLTSVQPLQKPTGFVRAFEVSEVLPCRPKALKAFFRSRPAREYEIKCRHLPIQPEAIRRSLPVGDGPPCVVFALRSAGKSRFVVARRCPDPTDQVTD